MNNQLFEAIERHNTDLVAKLLAAGADPNSNQREFPAFTALQAAIEELEHGGSLKVLEVLMSHGADVNRWDEARDSTPLLMAIVRNQFTAVDLLLAAGADPNVRGAEGDSPLRWCAERSDLNTVKLLLAHGAARTIDSVGGERGMTALGLACGSLNLPMVELLLDAAADPEVTDDGLRTAFERLPPRTRENAATWNLISEILGR